MTNNRRILLTSFSEQVLTEFATFIELKTSSQVVHRYSQNVEQLSANILEDNYDLIIFFDSRDQIIDLSKINALVSSTSIPIILVFKNPTVDQTVDMMNAGISGIADWDDKERVIELVNRNLTHQPVVVTEPIYQNIVEHQTELVCRYDTDFRLLFANRAYCEWQGLPADELLGKSFLEKIPEADREVAVAHVKALSVDNPVAVSIHSAILPDGDIQTIEWTDRAIFDETGGIQEYQGVGRDVSEREQVAEVLRESEEKYRTLVESSEAVIVVVDEAGELYFANEFTSKQMQMNAEAIVNKNMYDLFPTPVVDYQLKMVRDVIRTGKGTVYEASMPVGDRERWYRTSIQPLRSLSGTVDKVLVNAADITSFKVVDKALHHSEEKFRSVYEQSPIAIQIYDSAGSLTDVNQRTLELYGIEDKKYLLGYNFWSNPDLTQEQIRSLKNGEAITVSSSLDFAMIKEMNLFSTNKSGIMYFDIYVSPLMLEGETVGYLTQMVDMTQRNQAQYALEEVNQKLEQRVHERTIALERAKDRIETIFNHSADGILLLDAELRIQQGNKAFEKLFGFHAETYFHKLLTDLITDNYRTTMELQLEDIINRHEIKRLELHAKRQDGSTFDAEISVAPIHHSDGMLENIVCIIRDISERKEHERQLQYHASLQENVNDAVIVMDMDYVIHSWNKAAQRIYGWTEDEALGKSAMELSRVKMSSEEIADVVNLLYQQGWWQGGVTHYHKNDSELDIWTSLTLIKDDKENPSAIITVNSDISERKEYERQLQYHSSLQENVSDAVIVTDTDFIIQSWNKAAERIYGWTEEEALGKTSTEVLRTEMSPDDREHSRLQLQENGWWQGEVIQYCKDDSMLNILGSITLINDENGNPFSIIAVNRDITERKQAEIALRESEERYVRIANLSEEAILLTDEEARITYVNPTWTRLTGYSEEESMGRQYFEFLTPEYQEPARKRFEDKKAGTTFRLDTKIVRKDGSNFWVLATASPVMSSEDEFQGILAMITDIDVRKKVEIELAMSLQSEREMQQYLTSLHDISLKLAQTETLDDFYHVAVTEGLSQLGFERIALLLYDESDGNAVGTYGTDTKGKVVAEYHLRYKPNEFNGILHQTLAQGERFVFMKDTQLYASFEPIGIGETAAVALWHDQVLGWLAIDNGITFEPISQIQLDVLALYVLTVGSQLAIKQAEFNLRDSETRFRQLINAAPIATVVTNQNGYISIVNEQAEALFGYNRSELIGQAVEILLPDTVRKQHTHHQSSYIQEPHLREMGAGIELFAKRKDGSLFATEIQLSYVDTPDGIMVMSYVIDITEQKRTQAEVERQRTFLRAVIDASPSMIFVKDINGRFIFANPAIATFFDTSVEALMAKSDEELNIPENEVDEFHDADRRVITRGETIALEEGLTLKTGETRWLQTTKVPLVSEDGQSIHVLGISTDITERKQAEITLQQSLAKEKELSKLKSSFVSTASHQFRTPLAAILSTTDTLSAYRDRLNDSQIETRLDRIRNQVNRMKGLMDDVLELSRIQANQIQYKPEQGDLNVLCGEIIEDFSHQKAYDSRIVYKVSQTPFICIFDPHLMHHVMNNLIHNALKYSSATEKVFVDLAIVAHQVEFKVKDQGIGIPEDYLSNLYAPFSRAENVGSIAGTGLGLSIVQQSVEAHNGIIVVESEKDKGTTFIVKFPYSTNEGK